MLQLRAEASVQWVEGLRASCADKLETWFGGDAQTTVYESRECAWQIFAEPS